jgi:hypothetical protein
MVDFQRWEGGAPREDRVRDRGGRGGVGLAGQHLWSTQGDESVQLRFVQESIGVAVGAQDHGCGGLAVQPRRQVPVDVPRDDDARARARRQEIVVAADEPQDRAVHAARQRRARDRPEGRAVEADHREARADQVVEPDVRAGPFRLKHRLKDQLRAGVRRRRAKVAACIAWLGLELELQNVVPAGGDGAGEPQRRLRESGTDDGLGLHESADLQGHADQRGGVRPPLLLVGLEQGVIGAPVQDRCQLPCQVGRVADAAVEALPGEWRGQVRGIAREQDAPDLPPGRDARMEAVDGLADER